MRDTGAAAAVSPTSNLFLGSGFFDYEGAMRVGFRHGLASDVGGGTSFSPFHTMLAAYYVAAKARPSPASACRRRTCGGSTRPARRRRWAWTAWSATCSPAARPTSWCWTRKATPLLARKTAHARDLDELLFSLIVLGDDRVVERVHLRVPRGMTGRGPRPPGRHLQWRQERAA
jgi:guanine deaminase